MKLVKQRKISQTMLKWLLVCVVIAFAITTVLTYVLQTELSRQSTEELLRLNIEDVRQDIVDASDANLLKIARNVAAELDAISAVDPSFLNALAKKYDVAEINVVSPQGVITVSTYEAFVGFRMDSGVQSREFLCLLDGQNTFVQSYQPITWDAGISRKYAGVVLVNGGFVQVGYDFEQFRKDISQQVAGVTKNRRVGEGGRIMIADEQHNIVSDRGDYEGTTLKDVGLDLEGQTIPPWTSFEANIHGEPSYCMYAFTEGYYCVSVMLQDEATISRNLAVRTSVYMEAGVLAVLFVLVSILMKWLVVDNIHKVNGTLAQITDGNLDVSVNVHANEEFSSLSNDINATVAVLKRYIAEAAARIDAELEFARAIQHSALPSVFPPYPSRSDFEIFASMHTAKEVGGDFYDFYLVDEDTLAFVIADVSGKGIPAAMFMMTAKTILKNYAESGMEVQEVLTQSNNKLCEGNDAGMFVTSWLGIINLKTGLLASANAGHNPPLIRRGDGAFAYYKTRPGLVLAGMEGLRYRKEECQLSPGDTVFLYTDGVTEATNAQKELYGEERLLSLLNQLGDETMEEICRRVKEDVDAFVGEEPQFDDITMLAFKYLGGQKS